MSERVCEFCNEPTNGQGYVAVNVRKATILVTSWYYGHITCMPVEEDYCISEYDLRTPRQVEDWRALLAQKRWFVNTDWEAVLKRVGIPPQREGADYRPAKGGTT